jgi:predicted nuclease of predicted toxin-antitoxin system
VRLLLDTQLPETLVRGLRHAGHEVEHVLELAMGQSPGSDLWQYAVEHQAVVPHHHPD